MRIHYRVAAVIFLQAAGAGRIHATEWRYFSPILAPEARSLETEEADKILADFCKTPIHVIKGVGETCATRELDHGFSDVVDHTFHPRGVILGHFLGPETEDAVVNGWSAETHPSLWGGTLLLSKLAKSWTPVWYRSGMITNSCEKIPLPDHREILLCETEDSGMGHALHYLYTVDLLHPSNLDESLLAKAESFKDDCVDQTQVLKGVRWSQDKQELSIEVETTEWRRVSTEPYCGSYPASRPAPLRLTFAVTSHGLRKRETGN